MALPKDAVPISSLPDDAVPIGDMPSDVVSISQSPASSRLKDTGIGAALGIGGAAGVGLLDKGIDWIRQPINEIRPITNQINDIANQYGIKATPQDVPTALNIKRSDILSGLQGDESAYKLANQQATFGAKTALTTFDDKIMRGASEKAASAVIKYAPEAIKSGYAAYGSALDAADEFMAKQGKTISGTKLYGMFDNVVKEAYKQGVPEGSLDLFLEQAFNNTPENMTIQQAKILKKSLAELLPTQGQYTLTDNWKEFLLNNVPDESRKMIEAVDSKYKPFTQLRSALSSSWDVRKGDYDKNKVYRHMTDYIKGDTKKSLETTENILKALGEGTDITAPNAEIKAHFNNIKTLAKRRASIVQAISNIKSSALTEAERFNAIRGKARELRKVANKAESLLLERDAIAAKYPIRKFLSGVGGKLAGKAALKTLMKIGGLGMGVVGIIDAAGAFDPAVASESEFTPFERWQMSQQMIKAGKYPEIRAKR